VQNYPAPPVRVIVRFVQSFNFPHVERIVSVSQNNFYDGARPTKGRIVDVVLLALISQRYLFRRENT